ncbi:MAG: hypothetical protein WBS18_07695 [Candidatus Acidiferrales bacterium]
MAVLGGVDVVDDCAATGFSPSARCIAEANSGGSTRPLNSQSGSTCASRAIKITFTEGRVGGAAIEVVNARPGVTTLCGAELRFGAAGTAFLGAGASGREAFPFASTLISGTARSGSAATGGAAEETAGAARFGETSGGSTGVDATVAGAGVSADGGWLGGVSGKITTFVAPSAAGLPTAGAGG